MKTVTEVRRELQSRFDRHYHEWLLNPEPAPGPGWPQTVRLNPPNEKEAMGSMDAVSNWIGSWQNFESDECQVAWKETRWPNLGRQEIPVSLSIPDPVALCRLIGKSGDWAQARRRLASLDAAFPGQAGSFSKLRNELFLMGEADFIRLRGVIAWLADHPRSGLYPRELPISGVDSKWLESNKGSVGALLCALTGEKPPLSGLYDTLGLKSPPDLIRVRLLDPALRAALGGLGDFAAPIGDLPGLRIRPKAAFIVENLQTGLSFRDLPGSVLVMGLGYKVGLLGGIPWLKAATCLYWGDIDTHGFSILSRARGQLPGLRSILMDEGTFLSHRELWVTEGRQFAGDPKCLAPEERELFLSLKNGRWGGKLRLEQERVSWSMAWPLIREEAEALA